MLHKTRTCELKKYLNPKDAALIFSKIKATEVVVHAGNFRKTQKHMDSIFVEKRENLDRGYVDFAEKGV